MSTPSGYDDKNILYGGPEPELIDSTSKSLGEVILKKLKENDNDLMFVSIALSEQLKTQQENIINRATQENPSQSSELKPSKSKNNRRALKKPINVNRRGETF